MKDIWGNVVNDLRKLNEVLRKKERIANHFRVTRFEKQPDGRVKRIVEGPDGRTESYVDFLEK